MVVNVITARKTVISRMRQPSILPRMEEGAKVQLFLLNPASSGAGAGQVVTQSTVCKAIHGHFSVS